MKAVITYTSNKTDKPKPTHEKAYKTREIYKRRTKFGG